MCGRFTLTADANVLQQAFALKFVPQGLKPRYNIAPSQPLAVITNEAPEQLDFLNWGLIPSWSKDPTIGNRLINARAETAHEKPAFKAAMKYRRCLVPADGWFEWQVINKQNKIPTYIHKPDFTVFAFAGLWGIWISPDGSEIRSCTILTTDASDNIKSIHHRMPVVLRAEDYNEWLLGDDPKVRQNLLQPYEYEPFAYYAVSKQVNKPGNDSPENIIPAENSGNQLSLL